MKTLRTPRLAPRSGSALKSCLIAAVVAAVLLFAVGSCAASTYNGAVQSRQQVQAKWAEIDNQYKRRYDLVPQLIETVKGAADFEKGTLQAVIDARASVGKVSLPSDVPTDPAQLQAWIQAQQGLSGALGRLFALSENYPQLKATQNFLSLQDQLEGTENRIAVARRDYIDAVSSFNTRIQSFPMNLIAAGMGFVAVAQLEMPEEQREAPKIDFGGR